MTPMEFLLSVSIGLLVMGLGLVIKKGVTRVQVWRRKREIRKCWMHFARQPISQDRNAPALVKVLRVADPARAIDTA